MPVEDVNFKGFKITVERLTAKPEDKYYSNEKVYEQTVYELDLPALVTYINQAK